MPQFILHKDGAYNLYTTVADGACYESALRYSGGPGAMLGWMGLLFTMRAIQRQRGLSPAANGMF